MKKLFYLSYLLFSQPCFAGYVDMSSDYPVENPFQHFILVCIYIAAIKLNIYLGERYPKKKKLIGNIFGIVLIIIPVAIIFIFATFKIITQLF